MFDKREKKKFADFTSRLVEGPFDESVKSAIVKLCGAITKLPNASEFDLERAQAELSHAARVVELTMSRHLTHGERRQALSTRPSFFDDLKVGHAMRQVNICRAIGDCAAAVLQKHRSPTTLTPPSGKQQARPLLS